MIEFREYANQLKEKYHIESPSFYEDFVRFLVDNEWFQIQPKWLNQQLMIEYNDFKKLQEIIEKHFTLKEMSTFDKCLELWNMLNNSFPDTASKLADFYAENSFPKEIEYYINEKHNGDFNAAMYEMCLLKAEDDSISLSGGINLPSNREYWITQAEKYRVKRAKLL